MADETFVIVGSDGTEHEFPAGMDPKKAAGIVKAAENPKGQTIYSNRPAVGAGVAAGAMALGNAPAIASGIRSVATPQNLGYASTVYGLARAVKDVSEGHPLDAAKHAIEGSAPMAALKVFERFAPKAATSQNVLNYAKAAGETLNPANIVAAPTVGGAVDQYATSMGQRVVRLLGPTGEVLPSSVPAASGVSKAASGIMANVLPWLKNAGNVLGAASAEAEALARINSPESIAELAVRMNPAGRERLLAAYKSGPEYVDAIKAAISGKP